MRLAHRWELADVQAKAEALLVRKITPGTYRERTYPLHSFDFVLYIKEAFMAQCEKLPSR